MPFASEWGGFQAFALMNGTGAGKWGLADAYAVDAIARHVAIVSHQRGMFTLGLCQQQVVEGIAMPRDPGQTIQFF